MTKRLSVIAAGAVHAYFHELQSTNAFVDFAISVMFAPAGAVTKQVQDGAAYDIAISSVDSLETLAAGGRVLKETITTLGATELAVCTRDGRQTPIIKSREALKTLLGRATSIHIPDIAKSTAGAHMGRVFKSLKLHDALAGKLRTYANGAATMRAIAKSKDAYPLGFTQRSEIVSAPGTLLGDTLPGSLGLTTTYAAAILTQSRATTLAQDFIAMLDCTEQRELRSVFGFRAR